MNKADLDLAASIVKQRSGLVLTADKEYLLESRLSPLARKEGFASLDAMFAALRAKRDEDLMWKVTEALTTNETFFFRDKTPFDNLAKKVLPALAEARPNGGPLRIWSAACSSGQEPYSIAMVLDQHRELVRRFRVEIIATDICNKVLEKAQAGLFSQFEVQRGLPVKLMVQHFKKSGDMWRVNPALQSQIQFRRFNLLDDFRALGRFDIVFCRNVLIYFDQNNKADILRRITQQAQNDAFLMLGASETVLGTNDEFSPVDGFRGLYQRQIAPGASKVA